MAPARESRRAAGRARALTAKTVVGAGAVVAFGAFALLARASHASHQHGHAATASLRTPQSFLTALQQQSQDSFGGGQIAPPDQAPQVQSGTS